MQKLILTMLLCIELVYIIINKLLEKDADVNVESKIDPSAHPNDRGVTPMMMCAAGNANATTMDALIAKGADPRVANKEGRTVLMFAAKYGSLDSFKYLLTKLNIADKNLDTLKDNDGNTLLMIAVDGMNSHNKSGVADYLNGKANITLQNNHLNTACKFSTDFL